MDDSFNIQETRNYGLAIFFSDTTLTFCILDFKRNKFIGLQQLVKADVQPQNALPNQKISYPDFLDSVFSAMPWLKSSFKIVKIAYEGRKGTLIPAPLFDMDEKENYLKFNFQPGGEEQVLSDHLLSMDSYQVFAVPDLIFKSIGGYFQETKIVSAASVLIESIWINYKNRINTSRVFLHIRATLFDLMIFDGRHMTYFNTFPFQNPEDVTYYLIFVLEQLNFNPETVPLILLGDIEKGAPLFELLFKYVRQVDFGRKNEAYLYSYLMTQFPQHTQYPLFNFFSCGL